MKSDQKGFSPIIILVVLVVVGVVAAAGFMVFNKDSDSDSSNAESSQSSGDLVDAQEEIKDQDIKASLNEQVDLSNGYSIKVTGIERGWAGPVKEGRRIPSNQDGEEIVAVNVTITNNSAEEISIGGRSIGLIDESGEDYIEALSSYQLDEDVMLLEKLAPGASRSGQIIYPGVPKDAQLTYIYDSSYKNFINDEIIQLKAEIKL